MYAFVAADEGPVDHGPFIANARGNIDGSEYGTTPGVRPEVDIADVERSAEGQ